MISALKRQVTDLLDSSIFPLSDILPSEWTEQHRTMTTDESPFPGPFTYDRTPYCREIIDCLSPSHPAKIVAIMKGAQIGFSTGVIEPGIGWIISQRPGNILFLTGHSDLSEEAMNKIDRMIDNSGLRTLIRPNVLRKRNSRTGDTNRSKEFPGGSLVSGSATNHRLLRQRSVNYAFIDDYDAAPQSSKDSGSTTTMIEQRLAAYYSKMKLFYISTPELKQTSNIEPLYLKGDQRRYHVPCPHCGTLIALHWTIEITGTDGKEKGGITWKTDDHHNLLEDSVGYICQQCSGFFTDTHKADLLQHGSWHPTAKPVSDHYFSYHISSLYAPPGMYDWKRYVAQYLEANPPNAQQKEHLHKAFVNLCLGETFEQQGEAPKANDLQKNIRAYPPGTVPEKLSIADGNGKIVLLTCAADLNGTEEDARLDYEVLAWSESGATYSVTHGSIGTFIPREGTRKFKEDRERFTYHYGQPKSVWPLFEGAISQLFTTDTGRKMKVFITGIDTGHYTLHAYNFIDRNNSRSYVVGLKGKDVEKYIRIGVDNPSFRVAKERSKLYLVEVNQLKDDIAEQMKLRWDPGNDDRQPSGFMNYPTPSGGLYLFKNYFEHYEAEHRVTESKDGEGVATRWIKKSSIHQNHFFDVRVYNMVLRDILVWLITKELKITTATYRGTWSDYVEAVLKMQKNKT